MNNGDDGKKVDLTRRKVLAGFAASAGAIGLGACGSSEDLASSGGLSGRSSESSIPAMQVLPDPNASGIDHIVVVMMENRSFDHYLGWVPGANGAQAGLTFYDKAVLSITLANYKMQGACGTVSICLRISTECVPRVTRHDSNTCRHVMTAIRVLL